MPLLAALAILFPDPGERAAALSHCFAGDDAPKTRCLVRWRFGGDSEAARIAEDLFVRHGHVAGVAEPFFLEGGFRGRVQIVSELPVAKERRHLAWVAAAMDDESEFFDALEAKAGGEIQYSWRPLAFRFFRS